MFNFNVKFITVRTTFCSEVVIYAVLLRGLFVTNLRNFKCKIFSFRSGNAWVYIMKMTNIGYGLDNWEHLPFSLLGWEPNIFACIQKWKMHTICSSLNPLCISLNSSWWTASHFHLARNSVKSGNFSAKIAPSCWTVFIGVRKYFSHLSFTEQSETCEKYIFRNVVVALSLSNLPSFAKIFYEKGWRRSGEGDLIVRILCNEKDTL